MVGKVYETDACPRELVVTGFAEKDPPAPPSLKVTATPGTALLNASRTATTAGFASVVPTVPAWPAPETMPMVLGAPACAVSVNAPGAYPEPVALKVKMPTLVGSV